MLVFSFIVDSINKALVCGDGFGSRGCIAMSAFFFLVYMVPRRRRSWSMLWSTTSDFFFHTFPSGAGFHYQKSTEHMVRITKETKITEAEHRSKGSTRDVKQRKVRHGIHHFVLFFAP
jgi:hypothetical protein